MSTDTAPRLSPSRLDRLKQLRDRIETEIDREERFQQRIRRIGTAVAIASTARPEWSERVLAAAARYYDVSVEEIRSTSRDSDVTSARHVTAWLLREAGRSYPEIGRVLHRDHTTAMASVRRVTGSPLLVAAAASVRGELTGDADVAQEVA